MNKFLFIVGLMFSMSISAQTITLDNTFGTNGFAVVDGITNSGGGNVKVIVQPDGKLLVNGNRNEGTLQRINFIARFNSDGTIDTSFATNGFYIINYLADNGPTMHLLPSGKILVSVGNSTSYILRLDANGVLDTSFGTNGYMTFSNTYFDYENSFLDVDESFYINKTVYNNVDLTLTEKIVKINTNTGIIATSFGQNGELTLAIDRNVVDLVGIKNGKFLITTRSRVPNSLKDLSLCRININGTIDSTFGTNGYTSLFTPNNNTNAKIDFNNDFLVSIINLSNPNGIINKYDSNGILDTSFGNSGSINMLTNNFTLGFNRQINSLNLFGFNNLNNIVNLSLYKYTNQGNIDTSFNSIGLYIENQNILEEFPMNFSYQNDGNIFVSGIYRNGTTNKIFIAKYLEQNLSTNQFESTNLTFNNPVNDVLKFETNELIKSINIYSLDGKNMSKSKQNSIKIDDLSVGVYLAKVEFDNGTFQTHKIIKN